MTISRASLLVRVNAVLFFTVFVGACASPQGQRVVFPSEEFTESKKFAVGEITSKAFVAESDGINVKEMMTQSLNNALEEAGRKWGGDAKNDYAMINIKVVNYEPGNAFGRWLFPGVGATVLSVEGNLVESDGSKILAIIKDQRGVYAGGAYTIGAWKYIFDVVAQDIVRGLDRKTTGDAFIVEVDTWLKRDLEIPKATRKQNFIFSNIHDARGEKYRIGERFAAFGVSMGDVYFYRSVPDFVEEMVVTELRAAGHTVMKSGVGTPLHVTIKQFSAKTETTALYWDIVANIELLVTVGNLEKSFRCKKSERTYVWPTEELFNTVVDGCLIDMMRNFIADPIWQQSQSAMRPSLWPIVTNGQIGMSCPAKPTSAPRSFTNVWAAAVLFSQWPSALAEGAAAVAGRDFRRGSISHSGGMGIICSARPRHEIKTARAELP